jgi:hypothetical protein
VKGFRPLEYPVFALDASENVTGGATHHRRQPPSGYCTSTVPAIPEVEFPLTEP